MKKEIVRLELMTDYKPTVINLKLNELIREIRKNISKRNLLVVIVENN